MKPPITKDEADALVDVLEAILPPGVKFTVLVHCNDPALIGTAVVVSNAEPNDSASVAECMVENMVRDHIIKRKESKIQ